VAFQQFTPFHEPFFHYISAAQKEEVKDVEQEGSTRGTLILQGIEGRPPVAIERHHLAIDGGFIGQRREWFSNADVPVSEVIAVPRIKPNHAAAFDGQSPVPIKFNFKKPGISFWELFRLQQQHRLDESGFDLSLCHPNQLKAAWN
jgi:hypothetical protein